jgi:hypothetical protein
MWFNNSRIYKSWCSGNILVTCYGQISLKALFRKERTVTFIEVTQWVWLEAADSVQFRLTNLVFYRKCTFDPSVDVPIIIIFLQNNVRKFRNKICLMYLHILCAHLQFHNKLIFFVDCARKTNKCLSKRLNLAPNIVFFHKPRNNSVFHETTLWTRTM